MNALDRFAGLDWWAVAGWTMLHYLWLGLVVGAVAGVLRFALRRASANARYAVALVSLVALAVLPVGIGVGVAGVGSREPGARTLSGGGIVEASAKPQAVGEAVELAPTVSDGPRNTELASEPIAIEIPLSGAHPRQSRGLAGGISLSPYTEIAAGWLPWVWIVGAPVTFLLLCTGVVGAERLRRESRMVVDGPVVECLERLRASLSIGRRVAVAVCERVAAPVLVGVVRPLVLLPPAALSGWSPDEIEMVLLHELAHVRRWDNLVNLVQRFVEAVLFFQPAVWLVSGWVRREREACCDAVVVGATQRPREYAELLVEMAARMFEADEAGHGRPRLSIFTRGRGRPGSRGSQGALVSAMAAGPLRGRIRRILGIHDDPMLISGKSLGVVMSGLLLAATLVVLNLPGRSEAEQKKDFTTEDTESTEGKAEVSFVVGASRFDEGDKISISKVRGTKSAFEPGGTYWIEGSYTLASRDKASLSAFVTAKNADDGKTSIDKEQTMTVERGSGTFSLKLRMPYEGWPHVSFYPDGGGEGFGGVYFGTGDSVLAKWWDERKLTTEGTESTEEKAEKADLFDVGLPDTAPLFAVSDDNREETRRYPIAEERRDTISATLEGMKKSPVAAFQPFEFTLESDQSAVEIRAAMLAHEKYFQGFINAFNRGLIGPPRTVGTTETPVGLATKGTQNSLSDSRANSDEGWLRDPNFAYPRDQEIARKAHRVLGLKLVPAVMTELNDVYEVGYRGALKELTVRLNAIKDKPTFLVAIDQEPVGGFDTLDELLAKIHAEKKREVIASFMIGGAVLQKVLKVSAVPGGEKTVRDTIRATRPRVFDAPMTPEAYAKEKAGIATEDTKGTAEKTEGKSPTAGLEESLEKKISFCVALFNAPGRGGELRELSKKFQDEGRTIYLYGYTVDPNSPAGKRFGLTGAPTCIVFQHGQETARLDMIQTREQLVQLVEAESQKPRAADGTSAKSKFPTLEEQKLADLVWKRLNGLELEPLTAEQLKKVQEFGYEGGLRNSINNASGLQQGDILVGLHVWPTKSLQDVVNVLNRDDLGELNPLKYYVIRPGQPRSDGGFGGGVPEADQVVTGRMAVNRDRQRSRSGVANRYSDEVPTKPRAATGKPASDGTVEEKALQNRYGPPQPVLQSNLPSKPATNQPQVVGAAPSTKRESKQQSVPDFEQIPVVPLLDAEKAELVRRGPLRLQFYYSPDSEPCKRAEQLIEVYQQAYPKLFEVERINVLENPAIATQKQIGHLPTMIFYQGQDQLLQATGALELEELTEFITSFARGGQLRRIEPNRKPVLRYDGKTFHQWRTEWQTELSTAKRIEAVKALAAFGRAGYGKEAAAVILDVAGEYDFTFMQNDNDANGKLKQAVVEVLSPESGRPSLAEFWLPDLVARAKDDAGKWRPLLVYAVGQLRTDNPQVIGLLRTLAVEGPAEVRGSALGALVRSERISDRTGKLSEETRKLLATALTSDDLDQRRAALWLLVYDPNNPWALGWNGMGDARLFYLPEIVGPLLGADEELRKRARLQLQYVQAKDAPALLGQLLKVLQDGSRAGEHVEAIRAIAAMGPAGAAAKEELKKIVVEGKDEDALVAALFAVACINDKGIASLLASGNSPTSEIALKAFKGTMPALQLDQQQIEKLQKRTREIERSRVQLEEEAEVLFPESRPRQGGGMF